MRQFSKCSKKKIKKQRRRNWNVQNDSMRIGNKFWRSVQAVSELFVTVEVAKSERTASKIVCLSNFLNFLAHLSMQWRKIVCNWQRRLRRLCYFCSLFLNLKVFKMFEEKLRFFFRIMRKTLIISGLFTLCRFSCHLWRLKPLKIVCKRKVQKTLQKTVEKLSFNELEVFVAWGNLNFNFWSDAFHTQNNTNLDYKFQKFY